MGWQKGQSGNPTGRKHGERSRNLRTLLQQKYGLEAKVLVERLESLAKQDDDQKVAIKAIEVLLAYHSGRPTDHLELTGAGGVPFKVFNLMFPRELTE